MSTSLTLLIDGNLLVAMMRKDLGLNFIEVKHRCSEPPTVVIPCSFPIPPLLFLMLPSLISRLECLRSWVHILPFGLRATYWWRWWKKVVAIWTSLKTSIGDLSHHLRIVSLLVLFLSYTPTITLLDAPIANLQTGFPRLWVYLLPFYLRVGHLVAMMRFLFGWDTSLVEVHW